jgi:hypothetical protein
LVTRYSKTFSYKWKPFRYRPEEILAEINEWLNEQSGDAERVVPVVAPEPKRPGYL